MKTNKYYCQSDQRFSGYFGLLAGNPHYKYITLYEKIRRGDTFLAGLQLHQERAGHHREEAHPAETRPARPRTQKTRQDHRQDRGDSHGRSQAQPHRRQEEVGGVSIKKERTQAAVLGHPVSSAEGQLGTKACNQRCWQGVELQAALRTRGQERDPRARLPHGGADRGGDQERAGAAAREHRQAGPGVGGGRRVAHHDRPVHAHDLQPQPAHQAHPHPARPLPRAGRSRHPGHEGLVILSYSHTCKYYRSSFRVRQHAHSGRLREAVAKREEGGLMFWMGEMYMKQIKSYCRE